VPAIDKERRNREWGTTNRGGVRWSMNNWVY
jgi:hypothetical protein